MRDPLSDDPPAPFPPVVREGQLPFADRPFRLTMGLRSLEPADWIEVDEHFEDELALKRRLLAERHDDVVAVTGLEATAAASEELWSMVSAAAPSGAVAAVPAGVHPVEACGRVTQEDWVLLVRPPEGGPAVLGAACVCFPTRWVLRQKVGLTTREIHAPVAFYDEQLGDPVDRFLDRLTPERSYWRLNWNLVEDPELYQPVRRIDPQRDASITPATAGERVWLRVERQTLRALPVSGAVAFGIKVRQQPVAVLADLPGALGTLRSALEVMPEPTFRYKGLGAFADALRGWIEDVAGPTAPG